MDSRRLFALDGTAALVTGAGRGIGRAIAGALASSGAAVMLAGRDRAALETAAGEIAAAGGRVETVGLDVTDRASIAAAVEAHVAAFGRLDGLVNNAGVEEVCASTAVSEPLWDRIVDTNLKGAFFCAQAAAREMIAAGRGGAILNICSLTSYVGVPTAVPYGASKSGLLGMTRALSAEWAGHGVRVNAVAPGYFRTALTEVFYQDETWAEGMKAKIPMGRFGRLEDLAGAAVFLLSPASAYVTGQCIAVDGGYLAAI